MFQNDLGFVYEDIDQDKFRSLKESLLQSIEHASLCVSEETLVLVVNSETKSEVDNLKCLLQYEDTTQENFSEKQRKRLLQVFSPQNVQSMEETLFGKNDEDSQ